MKVCGIICEYNPLHNGHVYHMDHARETTGCDYIVCIMSGCFTQRGEPAIFDKWERTRHALQAGADLVIELPVIHAISSAQGFAEGSVGILDGLGVVTHLSFGSECTDLKSLRLLAEMITHEPDDYRSALKFHLGKGLSFPAARTNAALSAGGLLEAEGKYTAILSSPNCILGIEYMRALDLLKSRIVPVPVMRVGCGHNEAAMSGAYSSATSIRRSIKSFGLNGGSAPPVPACVLNGMKHAAANGEGPVFPDDFENLILASFRSMTAEEIGLLPDTNEGLAYRLKKCAMESPSLPAFLSSVKSKRYTHTRHQRICLYALLGISKADMDLSGDIRHDGYARILGFRSTAQPLLAAIKQNTRIPVISKPADYRSLLNPAARHLFELDARASDIYSLALKDPRKRVGGRDFTEQVIIL